MKLNCPNKQAQPVFKEPNRFPELADPILQGDFPVRGLNQAVAVAAMCLQEEAAVRPLITDVVTALSFLGGDPGASATPASIPSPPFNQNSMGKKETSHDADSVKERQQAVAEAIEWGSNSRNLASRSGSASSL